MLNAPTKATTTLAIAIANAMVQLETDYLNSQERIRKAIEGLNKQIENLANANVDMGELTKEGKSASLSDAMMLTFTQHGKSEGTAKNLVYLIKYCVQHRTRILPGNMNYTRYRDQSVTKGVPALHDPNKLIRVKNDKLKEKVEAKAKAEAERVAREKVHQARLASQMATANLEAAKKIGDKKLVAEATKKADQANKAVAKIEAPKAEPKVKQLTALDHLLLAMEDNELMDKIINAAFESEADGCESIRIALKTLKLAADKDGKLVKIV